MGGANIRGGALQDGTNIRSVSVLDQYGRRVSDTI